jgi:hypothetical protein
LISADESLALQWRHGFEEAVMSNVQIMSVVGSAVPAQLRERGLLACWYLVQDGEPVVGPFASLPAAQSVFTTWLHSAIRR